MAVNAARKRRSKQIVDILRQEYGAAECALMHVDAFELLIATILSAQCTDERVNKVTPNLFRKYPTAQKMARAPIEDLEKLIQSTGFFRNKAKNIKGCCEQLVKDFGGDVPRDLEKLITLPGVGRKTANVVLGTVYRVASGVVVDTHVQRISRRFGLTTEETPEKIERDLMALLPSTEWIDYSHRVIHHGRQVCKARKPLCKGCAFFAVCPRVGVP